MYKIFNNVSPAILKNIFAASATTYNIRNLVSSKMRRVHLVYNSTETLSQSGPKIWNLVPHEIKLFVSLGDFKSKITK